MDGVKRVKVQDLLYKVDMAEFWAAVEDLPDIINSKEHKKAIKRAFNVDGTAPTVVPSDAVETYRFIHENMGNLIHVKQLKQHREQRIAQARGKKKGTTKDER